MMQDDAYDCLDIAQCPPTESPQRVQVQAGFIHQQRLHSRPSRSSEGALILLTDVSSS